MSEPIPESIPTSSDPRSKRPTKRLALTPTSQQASQINSLFSKPDRPIAIPSTSTKPPQSLPPPPEIVANVQGSSAGAGSGEFHVYKASRRREYERLRVMEEEVRNEKEEGEWVRGKEERRGRDEERTRRNRARREKLRRGKKGKGGVGGEEMAMNGGGGEEREDVANGGRVTKGKDEGEGDRAPEPVKVVEEVGVMIHDDD